MASLKQTIQNDVSQSLKGGDEMARNTLRFLLASVLSKEKEKRYKIAKINSAFTEAELEEKSQLSDEEVIEVIASELKKRKEAILEFEKGDRKDLADKEKAEMQILQRYLPTQLPEEELRKLVQGAVAKVGATQVKDMGKVMAELMPKVRGRADGGDISRIVKEILAK